MMRLAGLSACIVAKISRKVAFVKPLQKQVTSFDGNPLSPNRRNPTTLPLSEAVQRHDMQKVAELLKEGESVNAQDEQGETALHHAARLSNLAAVDLLLKAGAQTDIPNYDFTTPRDMTLDKDVDEVIHAHETVPLCNVKQRFADRVVVVETDVTSKSV